MPAICALVPSGQHRAVRCELIGVPADSSLACRHNACNGIKVVPRTSIIQPTMNFIAERSRVMPPIGHLNPAGLHLAIGIESVGPATN